MVIYGPDWTDSLILAICRYTKREIKFGAWNKKDRELCLLHFSGTQPVWVIGGEPSWGDCERIRQFTGLTGKYGKDIFEADNLQEAEFSFNGAVMEILGTYIVKYDHNGFWLDDRDANEYDFSDTDEMTVIGNIYENPEPLDTNAA